MCKVGDIILVRKYKSQGKDLKQHSFVVLKADAGEIQGLPYDLVCNVMSSFHSEEHREKKLKYPGNLEYSPDEENVKNGHGRNGYIKGDQLYYFDRTKIDYIVLGQISVGLYLRLVELISGLDSIEEILDNLYK